MTLSLDGLDLLNAPAILTAGAPLQLPLDLIDEDPDQPRKDFDPVPLAELTDSVKARGVLQAISVRRHPLTPDRWMVNFGARRLRASRLAGKPTIPAYVDNAMDSYDQVIENEQRENLSPLELALFVQSRGISELYELRKLHESQAQAVAQWIEGRAHVSRADVQVFKERLAPAAPSEPTPPPVPAQSDPAAQPDLVAAQSLDPSARSAQSAPSVPITIAAASKPLSRTVALLGEVDGVQVRVLLDARVEGADCVVVSAVESAKCWSVVASSITCLRLEVLAIPAG
ncbi:MAG: ParB/RepB/Spo0J family partition protein [Rubrivivax sp.]|nr:ParB/RepB/Spo0J family partition protein [Rubrivivax sp.]